VLVGLCLERSLEMLVGLLGVLKSGAAYVPLDPGFPAERLSYMLRDSGASILLTQQRLEGLLGEQERVARVLLDAQWEQIARLSAEPLTAAACSEDLAYVIYTSGSTGRPKGVGVEHAALVNFLESMNEARAWAVERGRAAVRDDAFVRHCGPGAVPAAGERGASGACEP
jgi:non-ribosomal peptide synthetase component F